MYPIFKKFKKNYSKCNNLPTIKIQHGRKWILMNLVKGYKLVLAVKLCELLFKIFSLKKNYM